MKKINKTDIQTPQTAYLEGVVMPNGEFVCNGKSFWLKDNDKLLVEEVKPSPNQKTLI